MLADTERDGHRPAFNRAFTANGIDENWGVELYGKLLEVGGGKERMTAHWNEVGWPKNIPSDENARKEMVKRLHLQKTDIFMEMINEGSIPLRPGVLRLIDEAIANNIRLACCSTSNDKAVRNLIHVLMGAERASKFSIFAGDSTSTCVYYTRLPSFPKCFPLIGSLSFCFSPYSGQSEEACS